MTRIWCRTLPLFAAASGGDQWQWRTNSHRLRTKRVPPPRPVPRSSLSTPFCSCSSQVWLLAVLRPFATAILFGTILAIAAWPLREFLLRRGLKRGLDATLLLLLALAVVVLPLIVVAPGLAERLTQGAGRLQDYFASAPQVPSWLAGLPIVGERLARIWDQAMLAEGGIRA